MSARSHEDIAELLGAYALDAVRPEEAELVRRHIDTCPRCRDELAGHREVAGMLGAMGGDAPMGLWDQIAANATAHEPPPALRLPASASRARPRRTLRMRAVVASAAAAAAVVAVLGVEVVRLDHQTQNLNAEVTSMGPAPSMETVKTALATPGARQVDLVSFASSRWSVQAVVLPSGQGYLYHAQLDPIPADRTYQLWGLKGTQRISYGLLGTDPTTVLPFRASPGLQSLAITNEVAGGVESSTQPSVVVGGLTPVHTRATPS